MKTTKLTSSMLLALALAGCGKPTDQVIPSATGEWDAKLAPSVRRLNDTDKELLAAYLVRAKLGEAFGGSGVPVGTTIGGAIENQKAWAAEKAATQEREHALAEEAKRKIGEVQSAIRAAVTVSLIEKSERPRDFEARRYRDAQVFKIAVSNTSATEIVGVSGALEFRDVFDKPISTLNFSISERIKPGQVFVWIGSRDYNEFRDSDRALWMLPADKFTSSFKPESVVFADGTKLLAEQ